MDLTFLSNVIVDEVSTRKVVPRGERNPTNGADLRVFADGSVYPSEALVNEMNLQYQRDNAGNGFDIIDSNLWGSYPKDAQRIMFISPIAKTEARVDLFGATKFNEDGTPKADVLTQGSTAYGKNELIPTLKEVYGIEVTDFVDLQIERSATLPPTKSEVYNIPKKKMRNTEGDEVQYLTTRREKATFYALIPFEEKVEEATEIEHEVENSIN